MKITDYADELLECARPTLDRWPEKVRLMQENWIGKSCRRAKIKFPINVTEKIPGAVFRPSSIEVFTTRT